MREINFVCVFILKLFFRVTPLNVCQDSLSRDRVDVSSWNWYQIFWSMVHWSTQSKDWEHLYIELLHFVWNSPRNQSFQFPWINSYKIWHKVTSDSTFNYIVIRDNLLHTLDYKHVLVCILVMGSVSQISRRLWVRSYW